jgi:hypothetical protein
MFEAVAGGWATELVLRSSMSWRGVCAASCEPLTWWHQLPVLRRAGPSAKR